MKKGRGISALSILLALMLSVTGCGFGKEYSGVSIENGQEVAAVIRQTMQHRSHSVKIRFRAHTLDKEGVYRQADELMTAAFYESEDPSGGDYLKYQYGGYEMTYHTEKKGFRYEYQLTISPEYYTTAEEEAAVDAAVAEVVAEAYEALGEDAPAEEKIAWVHDFICDTVSYDTVHKAVPGSHHIQSTAYGALIYHTALCQGYAVLCYRLLKELGVDVRIVTGTAMVAQEPERHAWNIVNVGGLYYNLDVTLDDETDSYDYFLKNDADFAIDHTREAAFSSTEFMTRYPMSMESLNQ